MKLCTATARLAGALAASAATVALAAAPALGATAPSALTGPVSALGSTTATLGGTVNPNGTTTTYVFQYGPSATDYTQQTTAQSAGSGTSDTPVSASLTALSPATTYHYRLVATSSGGTTNGSDGVFTTTTPPGAVTAPATNLGTSSATLNGSVDPNGQATSYFFEYGTTTSYGSVTNTSSAGSGTAAVAVSAALSGLQAGQTYHFRLVAENTVAGTTDGNDMSFSLSSKPTVTTSAATSVTATGARLNGSVNPNGEQTSWYFQYGSSTGYGSQTASQTLSAGGSTVAVAASLSGLAQHTIYHFRLVASNAAGTSYGADQTFGSASPPAVQTGSAQGAGPSSVTLTGTVNPEGNSTTYSFQYGTTTAYGSTSAKASAGSGTSARSVSLAVSGLAQATTYHYRIVATNAAGTSYGGDVAFTTPSAITLVAESSQDVYGRALTLSGAVAGAGSGVKVTVLAEQLGQSAFSALTTVETASGGSWSYQARPGLQTSYEASANGGTSLGVTIGVRPAITLRLITRARFLVHVSAASPFAGKTVKLQRLGANGRWSTVAQRKLTTRSSAVFAASALPKGSSTIRVAMSINQAGRGYLAGFSRTLSFTRS